MKLANTIVKILAALATVAGVIYIVATYGERIVAWCKKTLAAMNSCPACEEAVEEVEEEAAEEAAEEAVEAPAEEPAPEVVVDENAPVAEEADFAE